MEKNRVPSNASQHTYLHDKGSKPHAHVLVQGSKLSQCRSAASWALIIDRRGCECVKFQEKIVRKTVKIKTQVNA